MARSTVALTLADPRRPDCPLVAANAAFGAATGYAPAEVVGRNCRFLQPPGGAGPVRARMRAFLADARATEARFAVPNVRRDGTPFLNLVYMATLSRGDAVEWVLGAQFDLTRHRAGLGDYERALGADLRTLGAILREGDRMVLGTLDLLAGSHARLARGWM